MCHLSSAEHNDNLDLIPVGKKTLCVVYAGVEVMRVDTAGELNLLDLNDLLLFACFLFLFIALEAELAVVHCACNGGHCLGSDKHKVKSSVIRVGLCGVKALNAKLLALFTDKTDFLCSYFVIDKQFLSADGKAPPRKIKKCAKNIPHINTNSP